MNTSTAPATPGAAPPTKAPHKRARTAQAGTPGAADLPPLRGDEFVKFAELVRIIDMSRAWFLTECALDAFPKFARIDAYLIWRRSEVQQWIADKLAGPRFPAGSLKAWPNTRAGNDRLIGIEEAGELMGVSMSTIWRKVRAEEVPGGVKLGQRSLWSLGEVSAFVSGRFDAARDGGQGAQS